MADQEAKLKTYCNECKGERNHAVRARHIVRFEEDPAPLFIIQYCVVECLGCENTAFLKRTFCDEDIEYGYGPNGETIVVDENWREEQHPAPSYRREPDWLDLLNDDVLQEIMRQIYRTLCIGSNFLAAVGTRTALDRIIVLRVGDKGNFKRGLNTLKEQGVVSGHEHEILSIVVEAGHAAAHRGHAPSDEDMATILDTLENLMHRLFILEGDVKRLKHATPGREASSTKPKAVIGRRKPSRTRHLFELGLPVGTELTFSKDSNITAKVHDGQKIMFRGEVFSLSRAALIALNEAGYNWRTVNGWGYWYHDGKTLSALLATKDKAESQAAAQSN